MQKKKKYNWLNDIPSYAGAFGGPLTALAGTALSQTLKKEPIFPRAAEDAALSLIPGGKVLGKVGKLGAREVEPIVGKFLGNQLPQRFEQVADLTKRVTQAGGKETGFVDMLKNLAKSKGLDPSKLGSKHIIGLPPEINLMNELGKLNYLARKGVIYLAPDDKSAEDITTPGGIEKGLNTVLGIQPAKAESYTGLSKPLQYYADDVNKNSDDRAKAAGYTPHNVINALRRIQGPGKRTKTLGYGENLDERMDYEIVKKQHPELFKKLGQYGLFNEMFGED